jgi:hypothetical protein
LIFGARIVNILFWAATVHEKMRVPRLSLEHHEMLKPPSGLMLSWLGGISTSACWRQCSLSKKKKTPPPKGTRLRGASLVHIDFFFIFLFAFLSQGMGFTQKEYMILHKVHIRYIKKTRNKEKDGGDEAESSSSWGIANA